MFNIDGMETEFRNDMTGRCNEKYNLGILYGFGQILGIVIGTDLGLSRFKPKNLEKSV